MKDLVHLPGKTGPWIVGCWIQGTKTPVEGDL